MAAGDGGGLMEELTMCAVRQRCSSLMDGAVLVNESRIMELTAPGDAVSISYSSEQWPCEMTRPINRV